MKPGNGVSAIRFVSGDRVADLRVAHLLDVRDDEPHFAGRQLGDGLRLGRKDAHLLRFVVLPFGHQPDLRAGLQRAVDHAHDDDDAAIGVVPRVEDQRLQRRLRVSRRRRQTRDHRLQHVRNADALFGAGQDRGRGVQPDDLLNLPARLFRLRAGQIDLVDDGNDLEAVLDRQIRVGQRLRFHALRRVDQQHGAFARGQRPGDFVGEIHVARRVDEVQDVGSGRSLPCS